MSERWTAERIPDQSGRTAVVTGANSGLGLVTARELARAGALVVLGCRDAGRGMAARDQIAALVPEAELDLRLLDLASLDSVRAFADDVRADYPALDLLINNAGIMATPRGTTADGFELQLGVNHLGHFALTGHLLSALKGREGARVVTVTSTMHRTGRINFDNLQGERRYFRWRAYGQAKLANLLFAFELQRRLAAADSTVSSNAAHPGYAATELQSSGPPTIDALVMKASNKLFAQSAERGALPTLYAATEPGLPGGSFIGPDGLGEQHGYPAPASSSSRARDEAVAKRLWDVSEELTGVAYEFGQPAAA
jgi:NAD(P)-dependent dehydrogenase (short-subunit alcohol dehydrogenase family)